MYKVTLLEPADPSIPIRTTSLGVNPEQTADEYEVEEILYQQDTDGQRKLLIKRGNKWVHE